MTSIACRTAIAWIAISAIALCGRARAAAPLAEIERLAPGAVTDATEARTKALKAAADKLDDWGGRLAWQIADAGKSNLESIATLIDAKDRVDQRLQAALSLRAEFGKLPADDESQRNMIRQYLSQTSCLIDLSGRMRYVLRDAVDNASLSIADSKQGEALIDQLTRRKVAVGGQVMSYLLFEPEWENGQPVRPATKEKILELIAVSGQPESLADVVDFLHEKGAPAALVIKAAEVVRRLGLPQDPLPGQDVKTNPPAILAPALKSIVAAVKPQGLSTDLAKRRSELIAWLDQRITKGVVESSFRIGDFEVQSGDWLLMRNPSPYNMFTDMAPGLFTHVGVVADLRDDKGVRRFVITDLPEVGDRIPAETVDAYLFDTQHCVFLRHTDAKVRAAMGKAAADMIGNETQFDLLFETARVAPLAGEDLRGKRIHTYCAGFLLICAQQTGRPREEFFPLAERRAGGHCEANLDKLGLAIGDDIVSPTGALFSASLAIVGRREPIYDPARQVKEHVYDTFGRYMAEKTLTPAPDLYQSLRQTVADMSQKSPWLARALAKVNNVSPYMDLESAAKAAAVVETLDRIADESREGFLTARRAFLAGPESTFAEQKITAEDATKFREMRVRHAALYKRWAAEEITPRQLRIALVDYYQGQGRKHLEEKFFNE